MKSPRHELETADEIAAALRLSPHTVKQWARDGVIPCVWLSRTCRRFDRDDVLAAVKRTQIDDPPAALRRAAMNAEKIEQLGKDYERQRPAPERAKAQANQIRDQVEATNAQFKKSLETLSNSDSTDH